MEPLSCVVHGVEQARLNLADQMAILSADPIGNLILKISRLRGAAQLTVMENNLTLALAVLASGVINLMQSQCAEHHPHYGMTEIRLEILVRAGAGDDRDAILPAKAHCLG